MERPSYTIQQVVSFQGSPGFIPTFPTEQQDEKIAFEDLTMAARLSLRSDLSSVWPSGLSRVHG